MLVMDYLMSQQDRFGNIHEIDYYYFAEGRTAARQGEEVKVDDHARSRSRRAASS